VYRNLLQSSFKKCDHIKPVDKKLPAASIGAIDLLTKKDFSMCDLSH